jgi:hypothetical protein
MSPLRSRVIEARIIRKHRPKTKLTRHNYRRRAIGALRTDFEDRCAYSMQHCQHAGGMSALEIDHFDPRRKNDHIQDYDNLFLARRNSNLRKSANWPSPELMKRGIRFLNCCEEMDYGKCIFEDPITSRVFGTTPAAKYHIRVLDLNAEELITERKTRANIVKILASTSVTVRRRPGGSQGVQQDFKLPLLIIQHLREQLKTMIPSIGLRPEPPH